ncbi:MAG: heavy-metal-associated domain-containing protein [Prevotellaceae bacterium]|nr:heavy-metal-associated domain-containing protein [Prevotellaceae bacterium]
MKRILTMVVAAMLCCVTTFAKDLKVLVVNTSPEMHCNSCETKIKNNIRFTAGVKKIDTNLETKKVTITYDGDKTDVKTILAAFKKIGYTATVVSNGAVPEKGSQKKPVDAVSGASQQQHAGSAKK